MSRRSIDVEIIWQITDQVIPDFKGRLLLIRESLGQRAKPLA